MILESIADHLTPACEQVLETMFFSGILSAAEQFSKPLADGLRATVRFEGPPDGEVSIDLGQDAAAGLACSFLGLESSEVTLGDCEEVAGELANMLCGAVLSHSAPSSEFHLHPPVLGGVPGASNDSPICLALELPEGPLNVCLRVDRL